MDGVTEDSVLNFALKGLFDTDDQPETEHKCHKSEAYCAKMSCDLGMDIYGDITVFDLFFQYPSKGGGFILEGDLVFSISKKIT